VRRSLYCEKCGPVKPLHPEDVALGFKRRRVTIRQCAAGCVCDQCSRALEGSPAIAETIYQGAEPGNWEEEFEALETL